ncbi:Metalloenzyme, LuxS/M16 peptidase-like protein [Chytriomyces sp. MP71]|nr:Metalloenzyme, LuxS/M16 peptidase-like protein [Chytriomyces sp. MP71]
MIGEEIAMTKASSFEGISIPLIDDRRYRLVALPNGLRALLISDEKTDRASAAMDVGVGYLSDPANAPGLAHFLEHLLFLGTNKYPVENEYSQFLSDVGGGFSNAYTGAENTNFYFEVSATEATNGYSVLEGALDRFAQFFISPLFDDSCTDRELNAVDSEHKKNIQDDDWRIQQLDQDLCSPGHAYCKFGTGNLTTLKEEPETKGLRTREMCIDFYRTNYSANIMNLVVLGKESLDQLESWVAEKFSAIENKMLSRTVYTDNPLTPNELGKLIRVKPVKESQILTLTWPWRDTSNQYLKSPNKYICHMIGHESDGSILSLLKTRGLASDLSCFPSHGATGFDFFKIQIELSDKGLGCWEEVVSIIFSYIRMLRESEPLAWVYDECSIMSNLSFKYMEKGSPSSFCSALASNMHEYPPEHILCGAYLMEDFDPALIKDMISLLNSYSFRIMLVAANTETEGWQTASWYGTEFKVEPLSASLLASLAAVPISPELTIFKPNPYVPHCFETPLSPPTAPIHPVIIRDTPLSRIWHMQDTRFKVPRANVTLFFKSPLAYASPRNAVLTALYCELVVDTLSHESYYAEMAELFWDLDVVVEGFVLTVGGYADKVGVFLEVVMKGLVGLVVDSERFTYIKERLIRDYGNFDNENPDGHASYFLTWMLQTRLWKDAEKLQEIAFITAQDVAQFYPLLLNPVHIESLVHGIFDRAYALDLQSRVESILEGVGTTMRPLPAYARFDMTRTFLLPQNASLIYRRKLPNPENVNNAVEVYFQLGDPLEVFAKASLLDQIASEPCFDVLRTKEQLGYVTWCAPRFATGVCGFLFHVQSERTPAYVEERILAFVDKLGEILESLSEEEFMRHCTTLSAKLLQTHKNLYEAAEFFWEKVSNGSYSFDMNQTCSAQVLAMRKEDMVTFYQEHLSKKSASRRKLSVQIWSEKGIQTAEGIIDADLMNMDTTDEARKGDVVLNEAGVADLRSYWMIGRGATSTRAIEHYHSF